MAASSNCMKMTASLSLTNATDLLISLLLRLSSYKPHYITSVLSHTHIYGLEHSIREFGCKKVGGGES